MTESSQSWDDGSTEGAARKAEFTQLIGEAFRKRFAETDFEKEFLEAQPQEAVQDNQRFGQSE